MKNVIIAAIITASLSGCGRVAVDGEMIGQAKKVVRTTNLICPDYLSFDMSLGVMQDGTGSMSTQDIWFTVESGVDMKEIKAAVDAAAIVRVTYDQTRMFSGFCNDGYLMTGFEIVKH